MMLELLAMLGNAPPTTLPAEYVGRITASDAESGEFYGISLALSQDGQYFVVAARLDDDAGAGSGAIYIYLRTAGAYVQQTKIISPVAGINFGNSVAIDNAGQRIAVGHGTTTNAAYVYVRSGLTWSLEGTLTPSVTGGSYGASVSIDGAGTKIAVGAPFQTVSGQLAAGSVFVFTRSGSTWSEQSRLTKTSPAAQDHVGNLVHMSNNGLYIAACGGSGQSVTYLAVVWFFNVSWAQQAVLGNTIATQNAAVCLSTDGSRAFVLEPTYSNGGNNGRVLVYTRSGTNWVSVFECLVPSPRTVGQPFGNLLCSIGCSGDGSIVVFAGTTGSIARYELTIFKLVANGDYMLMGYAQSRDATTGSSGFLATAISLDGKTGAVGVNSYDAGPGGTNGGAAWVWTSTDNL